MRGLACYLTCVLTVFGIAPTPVLAGGYIDVHAGTECQPTNSFKADHYEYHGTALVNTARETGKVFLAACPVDYEWDGIDPTEFSVMFLDDEQQDTFCWLFGMFDREPRDAVGDDWDGAKGHVSFRFDKIGHWPLSVTCLVQPGARLEGYRVVYEK